MAAHNIRYYASHKFCYRLSVDDLRSLRRYIDYLIHTDQIHNTNIIGLHSPKCNHKCECICACIINTSPLNCAISHNAHNIIKYILEKKGVVINNFESIPFPGSAICRTFIKINTNKIDLPWRKSVNLNNVYTNKIKIFELLREHKCDLHWMSYLKDAIMSNDISTTKYLRQFVKNNMQETIINDFLQFHIIDDPFTDQNIVPMIEFLINDGACFSYGYNIDDKLQYYNNRVLYDHTQLSKCFVCGKLSRVTHDRKIYHPSVPLLNDITFCQCAFFLRNNMDTLFFTQVSNYLIFQKRKYINLYMMCVTLFDNNITNLICSYIYYYHH